MDAGIIDAINRRDVKFIVARLDSLDLPKYRPGSTPWWTAPLADTLMSEDPARSGDRAWIIGALAGPLRNIHFDGEPAGGDWDNMLSYFRAEIQARRDSQAPPVREALTPCGMV